MDSRRGVAGMNTWTDVRSELSIGLSTTIAYRNTSSRIRCKDCLDLIAGMFSTTPCYAILCAPRVGTVVAVGLKTGIQKPDILDRPVQARVLINALSALPAIILSDSHDCYSLPHAGHSPPPEIL